MADEILNISERLAAAVKSGAVENYGGRGMVVDGDKKAMGILHRTRAGAKLGLNEMGWGRSEGFTRVGLVPLSSSLITKDIVAGFNPQDVAVCVVCYGEKVDQSSRSGLFRSVIIMSQRDAEWFASEVRGKPGLVFSLIRYINRGPIRKFDGTPASIKPGKVVEILPNTSVGGTMSQKVESAPFPPGFNPNPPPF